MARLVSHFLQFLSFVPFTCSSSGSGHLTIVPCLVFYPECLFLCDADIQLSTFGGPSGFPFFLIFIIHSLLISLRILSRRVLPVTRFKVLTEGENLLRLIKLFFCDADVQLSHQRLPSRWSVWFSIFSNFYHSFSLHALILTILRCLGSCRRCERLVANSISQSVASDAL